MGLPATSFERSLIPESPFFEFFAHVQVSALDVTATLHATCFVVDFIVTSRSNRMSHPHNLDAASGFLSVCVHRLAKTFQVASSMAGML